jgi:hypothetical protein
MLEQPDLVAAVRGLEGRVLGRVIDRVGLEDAGELVALATPEQLTAVLDEDLWRSRRPGQDEEMDPDRFALWLEILREAGDQAAAARLVELDHQLVALGLHRALLVVESARLGRELGGGGTASDLLDKALDESLVFELDDYHLIARRHDGWDAIIALLVALDRDHHDYLMRLLEQLAYLSAEQIDDDGGLYEVLTSGDMLEVDVAAAREDRRAGEGFVAPSSATAFLKLARTPALAGLEAEPVDPITAAYFRQLGPPRAAAPGHAAPTTRATDPLVEVLLDEEVIAPPRAQLSPASSGEDPLAAALAELFERDPARHVRCLQELAYLANVLAAGHAIDGRAPRPAEAADLALATCRHGLSRLHAREPAAPTTQLLARFGPVKLFRAGWPETA